MWGGVLYCIVLYYIVLLRLTLQHKAGVNGGPGVMWLGVV